MSSITLKKALTIYDMKWDHILALRIHRELKSKGYTKIRVVVMDGKWAASATIPGGLNSENYKG